MLNGSEGSEVLIEIAPFNTYLQRWQYRATATYYLCNYAIKRDPALIKFGAECNTNIDKKFYLAQTTDQVPYQCALLSFCPDFCFGKAAKEKPDLDNYQNNEYNPCYGIGDGSCELDIHENGNFDTFKLNYMNFTCECGVGFRFFSKFGICIDVDECDTNTHDCFGKYETCLNTLNGFECSCRRGFKFKYTEKSIVESVNHTVKVTNVTEKQCVRFNDLDKLEEKIDEINHKYTRETIINMFKLIHQNQTSV